MTQGFSTKAKERESMPVFLCRLSYNLVRFDNVIHHFLCCQETQDMNCEEEMGAMGEEEMMPHWEKMEMRKESEEMRKDARKIEGDLDLKISSYAKLGPKFTPGGNEHLNEAFRDHVGKCNVAWLGAFPGVMVDLEAKIADLRIPFKGVASRLSLASINAIGTHNYHNAAVAALSVLGLDVGIDTDSIGATIESLSVPPHRMQIVHRDTCGVTWVDDSKATNVESTYTGLMGLKEQKSVVLLGGLAKVLNSQNSNGFEQLVEPLSHHRCVVTFGASGKMIQETLWAGGLRVPCIRATNLEDAVNCARSMAKYGDAIVLSPACASFDEFRNFEHRGKFFQELAFASL